jgi:PAS domain S-box-containing protein
LELVRVQPEESRERRGAPRELDEAVLRRIYDSGIVGVAVWDGMGRILQANDRFLEIVGYTRAEVDARQLDWQRLSRGGEPQPWQAMPQQRSGGAYQPEFKRYVRPGGEPVYVRVHSTTLGNSGKTLSVVVDATEQRKAQDERDALLARERAAREEAQAAVRSRDDILAIVSHDLRNPLNTIAMSLSLIEMEHGPERARAQAGIIRRAIANMNRLIQDLLDVNQIAAGQLVVHAEPLEVAALLDDSRASLATLALRKNQRFEMLAAAAAGMVMADRERVSQVLSNLVGNAVKFTPEGGRIVVSLEPGEREVRFCVSDTGPGIEAQDLPHIFDRFWQVRRLRRGGVGLGLAITKGIVEAHGGRIWARSVPGIGSEFFFTLRRAGAG